MKKILLFVAAAVLIVACGGSSVEDKVVDYLQKIENASDVRDLKTAKKLYEEMSNWLQGLSIEDQQKAQKAAMEYMASKGYDYDFDYDSDYDSYTDYDEDYEYSYDEEEYVEESGDDWDILLDEYEEYVNDAVRLYNKAMKGDVSAITEFASLAEKAQSLTTDLSNSINSFTMSQANRFSKISEKLVSLGESAMNSISSSSSLYSSYDDDDDWGDNDDDDWGDDDDDDWGDDDDDDWGDDEW